MKAPLALFFLLSTSALADDLALRFVTPSSVDHVLWLTSAIGRTSPELCTLTVIAEGVANSTGVVGVLVFNSPEGWPDRVSAALKARAVPAHAGITEVTIPGLAPGKYAVAVLHDENKNQKLDRNWLGIPTEQWGMSNNPSYVLSAPSFESALFRLARDEQIQVQLH
jgi:uncharacterized protein (DUF2141 family)